MGRGFAYYFEDEFGNEVELYTVSVRFAAAEVIPSFETLDLVNLFPIEYVDFSQEPVGGDDPCQ